MSTKNTNKFVQKDERGRSFVADHFVYRASVTNLAAGTSATSQIAIDADSDFIWTKTAYAGDIDGSPQTDSTRVIPLTRVAITDSGSGRNLQNQAVPIQSLAGHEGLPLNIVVPRVFTANSNVSVTFSNYSADDNYNNVELLFIGYKKLYL